MNYYTHPWRLFWRHGGRATRREYWIFSVVNFAIMGFIDAMAGTNADFSQVEHPGMLPYALLWRLIIIVPFYATVARRMHDIDRRGWWAFFPVAGLIFTFLPGTPGQNRFGENPRDNSANSAFVSPTASSPR